MTIHSEHPFLPPDDERSPVRRVRGRAVLPVSVWTTTTADGRRVGWTVSSFLVADGDPAEVLGLVDAESDLGDALAGGGAVAVSLLGWEHRALADAFAGVAPAPGGPFRLGSWRDTAWGPVLTTAPGWLGADVAAQDAYAGWARLIRGVVAHAEVGPDAPDGLLAYARGRYRAVG